MPECDRKPTPLLSVAVAVVLVNAVICNADHEVRNRVCAGPLWCWRWRSSCWRCWRRLDRNAGRRIRAQPERLWGIVAVAVAVAYGMAYFRTDPRTTDRLDGPRPHANTHLAVATWVGLCFALPLFDFGAISAQPDRGSKAAGLRWTTSTTRCAGTRAASAGAAGEPDAENSAMPSRRKPETAGAGEDRNAARICGAVQDETLPATSRTMCAPAVALRNLRADAGAGDNGRRRVALVEDGRINEIIQRPADDRVRQPAKPVGRRTLRKARDRRWKSAMDGRRLYRRSARRRSLRIALRCSIAA